MNKKRNWMILIIASCLMAGCSLSNRENESKDNDEIVVPDKYKGLVLDYERQCKKSMKI